MNLQRLYSKLRQAIDAYQMIEDGDRIALGISGGKDSLSLLYGLSGLRRFYPKKFELIAITVDLGYDGFNLDKIATLCNELDVEYHIVKTKIGEMSVNEGCSLCSRLRRGALTDKAIELGCNSIAYAHNMDDVVETMMLSLIYEGRFSTFYPVTFYEDNNIKLIRPFVFVSNADAVGFKNKYNLPIAENPCPYDKISERQYIRKLLDEINRHTPGVRNRLMSAITDGMLVNWDKDIGKDIE